MRRWAPLVLVSTACSASGPPAPPPDAPAIPVVPPPPPAISVAAPLVEAPAPKRVPLDPEPILFPDAAHTPAGASGCRAVLDELDRARCQIAARYEDDAEAARKAIALFEETRSVAGVLAEHEMDGGFRGPLHLVPEVPRGKYRSHLDWVLSSAASFRRFFERLERAPGAAPVRFRHAPLAFRFFRSVGRRTPSAYAEDWSVAYNVSGSLNTSADAVRETLFHEIFHLNDQDHGDWSARVLRPIFDAIVARCGARTPCLAPYAPGDTMVRGGTYYAFQPNNGDAVHEYAAELGLRYYREHRAAHAGVPFARPGSPRAAPFKCGPEENGRAWAAIIGEFFGGIDQTPPCVK